MDDLAAERRKRADLVANQIGELVDGSPRIVSWKADDLAVIVDAEQQHATVAVGERGDGSHHALELRRQLALELDGLALAAVDPHLDTGRWLYLDVDAGRTP